LREQPSMAVQGLRDTLVLACSFRTACSTAAKKLKD
jgi:hypothetical protein